MCLARVFGVFVCVFGARACECVLCLCKWLFRPSRPRPLAHTRHHPALPSTHPILLNIFHQPQAAAVRGHKRPAAMSSFSGSFTLVQRIQAAGGLMRTNIPMRSTILRIALTNKKQVRFAVNPIPQGPHPQSQHP